MKIEPKSFYQVDIETSQGTVRLSETPDGSLQIISEEFHTLEVAADVYPREENPRVLLEGTRLVLLRQHPTK